MYLMFLQQDPPDPAQIAHMMTAMVPLFIGFALVGAVLLVLPYWQIFKKAGFPPALSLLMFVPLVNFIMLYVLAFSRWKVVPVAEYPAYPAAGYPPPPQAYPPATYPAQGGYTQQVGPYAPGTAVAPAPQGYVAPPPPPPAV